MDSSAALICTTRGGLATARYAVLEHNFARSASNLNDGLGGGGGGSASLPLFEQRIRTSKLSTATTTGGLWPPRGSGRRKFCVQAVETSSKPKGARRRQVYVEPQWLISSNGGEHNVEGVVSGDPRNEESPSGRSWPSIATTEHQKPSSDDDNDDDAVALYYIEIRTAIGDRSSLSEPSAGILLAMIGENRKAILQTFPGIQEEEEEDSGSSHLQEEGGERLEKAADRRRRPREAPTGGDNGGGGSLQQQRLRFQRGATDILTVVGPDLGHLAALWIAPKAGTWRIEKATVTVLPSWADGNIIQDRRPEEDEPQPQPRAAAAAASERKWKGSFHLFEANETLLGADAWLAATELKPSVIREIFELSALQDNLLFKSPLGSSSGRFSNQRVARLRAESMKEYQDLKFSLLGFSSLLVAAGTSALAALGQGKLAEGFAVGGVGGFLYLLLLQRAVDQLPSSATANFSPGEAAAAKENKPTNGRPPPEGEGMNRELGAETLGNASEEDMTTKMKILESSSSKIIKLPSTTNTGVRVGTPGRIALVAGLTLILGKLAGGEALSTSTVSSGQLLAGVVGFLSSKVAVVLAALKPTGSSSSREGN